MAWAGVLTGLSGCLGIIWWSTGYSRSWFYTAIAVSVLSSAAGINTVTKTPNSEEARKKLVIGSIVFFFISLTRLLPETLVLRDTILYLLASSMFLIRLRRHEMNGPSLTSKKVQWSVGSLIVVSVAMFLAFGFSVGSSAGREVVLELFRKLGLVFETILNFVLIPVGYLVQWLVTLLQRFVRPAGFTFSHGADSYLEDLLKLYGDRSSSWTLPVWLRWLLTGSLIVACLVLLWLFVSRVLQQAEQHPVNESRMSLASSGAVKEWLDLTLKERKQNLRRSLQRLRRLIPLTGPNTLEELYARTTEFMSRRGFPRHPALTPFEYLRLIETQIKSSEVSTCLRTITVIFSQCYYANRKPEEAEWTSLLSAYHGLLKYKEWPTGNEEVAK
ncbi:MAG TPA: DUF4129 domain-containing protein [Firmicutes bacterium]|nr:DUF4129 domain-containing protein [Candidatus Fermentithermobacillaceae bacterium]